MKGLLMILSLLVAVAAARGQGRTVHGTVSVGAVYRHAVSVGLSLELSGRYHRAYEAGLTYYRHRDRTENYLLGVLYKPVLLREKNTLVRYRFGGQAGTDLHGFIGAPLVGIELLQSLSPRFSLGVSNTNGYYFNAAPATRWRIGAELGMRLLL